MAYDLIIRGGTVVDGSGLPHYEADLGIVGDRIASIARSVPRPARQSRI
jgi:N-acyl-D-aspartate/D-glutamate deacylase